MLISCHLESRGLRRQPAHSAGSYYDSHFEERRCESEQRQLRWNAALINLPPWSRWMRLLPPTQPSNRLLKGSVNASCLAHYVWSSLQSRLNIKKVTAYVLVFCDWNTAQKQAAKKVFLWCLTAPVYYRTALGVSPLAGGYIGWRRGQSNYTSQIEPPGPTEERVCPPTAGKAGGGRKKKEKGKKKPWRTHWLLCLVWTWK